VRTAVRTAVLLGGELAALVVLHHLGSAPGFALPRSDPARWLREAAPLDVTAAVLRVLALAAACWLLASTVWWLLPSRRGHVARRSRFAMPGSRRLAEWTFALTLVGGTAFSASGAAAATATASTTPSSTPSSAQAPSPTGVRTGRGLVAVPAPAAPAPPPAPVPPAPAATPTAPPGPGVHVIEPGENLWTIAAAQVGTTTNRAAGTVPAVEVAPYWLALCELNRATIRSGNPSLVYPGEVLQLPPA
jgi:hypothetical protein